MLINAMKVQAATVAWSFVLIVGDDGANGDGITISDGDGGGVSDDGGLEAGRWVSWGTDCG